MESILKTQLFLFVLAAVLALASSFQSGSRHSISGILTSNTIKAHDNSRNVQQKVSIINTHGNSSRESHQLYANKSPDVEPIQTNLFAAFQNPVTLSAIAFFYWYLLVFGAAAASNGLPLPDFIPMIPGWPPSDQDLVPVIEDSVHFFYISDALNAFSGDSASVAEQLPQLRLAFFNFAEAWVFAFLPILLSDEKRLPVPVVLGVWLGALGLTNAFLAPYLALRQVFMKDGDGSGKKSIESNALNVGFGAIITLVVGFASFQTILTTATAPSEWIDFLNLVKTDRTYLAFAVDLFLFSCFQKVLLDDLKSQNPSSDERDLDGIPFIGLLLWLFK
jgi:hypothetical protein